MNKEEQQQNLYRILLQRNQLNQQAIRRYRRRSNNYPSRRDQVTVSDDAWVTQLGTRPSVQGNIELGRANSQCIQNEETLVKSGASGGGDHGHQNGDAVQGVNLVNQKHTNHQTQINGLNTHLDNIIEAQATQLILDQNKQHQSQSLAQNPSLKDSKPGLLSKEGNSCKSQLRLPSISCASSKKSPNINNNNNFNNKKYAKNPHANMNNNVNNGIGVDARNRNNILYLSANQKQQGIQQAYQLQQQEQKIINFQKQLCTPQCYDEFNTNNKNNIDQFKSKQLQHTQIRNLPSISISTYQKQPNGGPNQLPKSRKKVLTQNNQSQQLTVGHSQAPQQKIYAEKLKQVNMTHNIRSTVPQPPCVSNKNIYSYNSTKQKNKTHQQSVNTFSAKKERQKDKDKISNSHKALLNLHSIVFENSGGLAAKPKTRFREILENGLCPERYSSVGKVLLAKDTVFVHPKSKQKFKLKNKQDKQKDKQKENIGLIYEKNGFSLFSGGSFSNITNIDQNPTANLATIITNPKPKKQIQYSDLQNLTSAMSSVQNIANMNQLASNSVSTLSYVQNNIMVNRQGNISNNGSNNNTNTGDRNKQNTSKTQQNVDNLGNKSQFLPQIKKLKQFRLNFHRLLRKQHLQSTTSNKPSNQTTTSSMVGQLILGSNYSINSHLSSQAPAYTHSQSHNSSYSLNHIINHTEPVLGDAQMSRRAFRIQAIPVHQIKWM